MALPDRTWQVGALVTGEKIASLDDVFDDHAHKSVGTYGSPIEAIAAAQSFGRAWLKGFKATATEQCGCDEI